MDSRWQQHQKLFNQYIDLTPRPLSSYAFVSIYAWKDFFDFEFEVIDGALCVFARNELGCFLYLPPLGRDISSELLDKCFEHMHRHNKKKTLSRVENVDEQTLKLFKSKNFNIYKKSDEYVYQKSKLAGLTGNTYKSKRSEYNHFKKNHYHEWLPYDESMFGECMDLLKDWADNRRKKYSDPVYQQMLDENLKVHSLILKNFKALGLIGRVVKVDHEIEAYTFGYALNDETFCILLEIAELEIKGLPTFVFSEFCRDDVLKKYSVINAMDDFEMKNLTNTKMSFKPNWLVPVYVVSYRE